MIITQELKNTVIDICKEHGKAKDILKKVNGKRDYVEIAKIVKVHKTTCSNILSKAKTFSLLTKEKGVYKKTPEFKHINIDRVLKGSFINLPNENSVKIRKRRKITNTSEVKKRMADYILHHFSTIPHPFSNKSASIKGHDLDKASQKLFDYLDNDIGLDQLNGLALRFYESFAEYFSVDRIRKVELINAFSNMVRCFEPYIKKVAAIKTNNLDNAKLSLNEEMIRHVISFDSGIKNHNSSYWENKPIHEACVRIVYPFRHIEAHEARDHAAFVADKIIYYMFASIIFVNLDY